MLPSVPVKHCRPALSIELMENSDKCWTNEGAAQKPIKNISLAKHHKRERSSSPEGNNSYGSRCYHWRSTKSERGCSCVDFYTDFIDVFLLFTHVLPEKKICGFWSILLLEAVEQIIIDWQFIRKGNTWVSSFYLYQEKNVISVATCQTSKADSDLLWEVT